VEREEKIMSKSQMIREALAGGKRLTLEEIIAACEKAGEQIFNRKKTYDLLCHMRRSGQIKQSGRGDARKSWLRGGKAHPRKTNGDGRPGTAANNGTDASIRDVKTTLLALNLIGHTLGVLKTAINRTEGDTELCAAFIAHEEAVQLARRIGF
jgi:hypothetical protein